MTVANITKRSERQKQILEATLELVATQGLLKMSISKISPRAKCSPGIIYYYFESKDEIMDTLFVNIFGEMVAYAFDGVDLERLVLERYKALWLRWYHFHRNNPTKTIFVEQ